MKYESPKYELSLLEAGDILMSGEANYTIEESADGSGNVIVSAIDLFK